MNDLPLDSALNDRLYTIEVPGYDIKEKIHILIDYILPKNLKNIGRKDGDILINKNVAKYLINKVIDSSKDKGIRTIEKVIKEIINKVNFLVINQDSNGKLSGFNLTFNVNEKLNYPVTLTTELVDIFCGKKQQISDAVFTMYT